MERHYFVLLFSAIFVSSATILSCLIVVPMLYNSINKFHENTLEEMEGFKAMADETWHDIMLITEKLDPYRTKRQFFPSVSQPVRSFGLGQGVQLPPAPKKLLRGRKLRRRLRGPFSGAISDNGFLSQPLLPDRVPGPLTRVPIRAPFLQLPPVPQFSQLNVRFPLNPSIASVPTFPEFGFGRFPSLPVRVPYEPGPARVPLRAPFSPCGINPCSLPEPLVLASQLLSSDNVPLRTFGKFRPLPIRPANPLPLPTIPLQPLRPLSLRPLPFRPLPLLPQPCVVICPPQPKCICPVAPPTLPPAPPPLPPLPPRPIPTARLPPPTRPPAQCGCPAGCESYQCPPGQRGQPGNPGVNGSPGRDGASGNPGKSFGARKCEPIRRSCKVCPAGPFGPDGEPGPDGIPGDAGPIGSPGGGPVYRKGLPGIPGPIGLPGTPGIPGKDGISGIPGLDAVFGIGSPGAKGRPGPIGAKGPNGTPGIPGSSWARPASPGPPGQQGNRGKPGEAGRNGPPGPTGTYGEKLDYCECPPRTIGAEKHK